jgi:cysteine synthase B
MDRKVQVSLLDKRPKTPLFRFEQYCGIDIYIKFEGANPSLCLKTRSAVNILENMKSRGELSSEKTIIDASSGSFGGALAWAAAISGYRCTIVGSSKMVPEAAAFIASLGAEVIKVGSITRHGYEYVSDLVAANPGQWAFADQLNNPDNAGAFLELGQELHQQLPNLSAVVASAGTGGSLCGVGRYMRTRLPDTLIVASIAKDGERINGTFEKDDYWTPFLEELFKGVGGNPALADHKVAVDKATAMTNMREMVRRGAMTGLSAGGVLEAARRSIDDGVIKQGPVVMICGDSIFKNLSRL